MERREFLRVNGVFAFAISTFGCTILQNDKITGDCKTTSDILGPFYRADAPIRTDLTFDGIEGDQTIINGTVFSEDCVTPLKNAMVDLWHADAEGEYDHRSAEFLHRARWFTKADGNYKFRTILPGRYLNAGQLRPQHFHFRVKADGHKELISQVYLKGDPYIKDDPWASDPKADLRILKVTSNVNGTKKIDFNIYLRMA
ncbi:MAG: hypothetical protein IIA45_11970 [Bacteroidetes bacterium]|nr:hypothetical protein [Bacteroidota bacterium]